MSNKVEHLRQILFDTIKGLNAGDIKPEQAKIIGELTQVVVNSAKVEVDFIRATNGRGIASGFLGEQPALDALPAPEGAADD